MEIIILEKIFSKFVLFFQIHELFCFEYLTILKNHKFWGSVVVKVFWKFFFHNCKLFWKFSEWQNIQKKN